MIVDLNNPKDVSDFFGEITPVTKEEVIKRGHWIVECFTDIGKRVQFERYPDIGTLVWIGEDNQDYVLAVQYDGYTVYHSPLCRYNVI